MKLFSRLLAVLPWTAFRLIFLALRSARRLAGKDLHVQVRRGGLNWALDLGETIDLWIWLTGSFQRLSVEALERLIRPGDNVLDIGANIGAHTLFMARAVSSSGRVFSFEPTDYAFGKLQTNLALNPALRPRVTAERMLLADSSLAATVPLAFHSSWPLEPHQDAHPGHGGALMQASGARAATLDEYCAENVVGAVRVIKLDVDGNECAVLRGARETLAKHKPAIVLEVSPCVYSDRPPDRFEDFVEILHSFGYHLLDEQTFAPLPAAARALEALVPPGGAINAIAVPASLRAAFALAGNR